MPSTHRPASSRSADLQAIPRSSARSRSDTAGRFLPRPDECLEPGKGWTVGRVLWTRRKGPGCEGAGACPAKPRRATVGAKVRRSGRRLTEPQFDPLSPRAVRTSDCAGRHLDRRKPAQSAGDPPGSNIGNTSGNDALPICEDDIDREAHEEGVHGVARGDDQCFIIEARRGRAGLRGASANRRRPGRDGPAPTLLSALTSTHGRGPARGAAA